MKLFFNVGRELRLLQHLEHVESLKKIYWNKEYESLHLEISSFVHFKVQILSNGSNGIHTVTLFKILNDMTVYTLLDL